MKSVKRNGYGKAPAQLSVNQKIFNVLMAFVLVFTLIPVTSLTYAGEANAEETNAESVAQQLSDTEGSLGEGSPQDIDSGQESTGGSEEFQGSTNSPEVQEGGSDNSGSNNAESNNQSFQQGGENQGTSQVNNNSESSNDPPDITSSGDEGDQSGEPTSIETEGSDEGEKQQRDAVAWQSNLDACEVGAELAIDANEIDELDDNQLPSNIPATLQLQFKLTPGKDLLLAGDWIELSLPSFLSFEDAQFDVFRLNEDETETAEKIADAKVENGILKITFIEAAATKDEQTVVRGFVDIPVTIASSMLGEEEAEQSWIVQTGQDGTERVINLGLPTYNAVLDAWNSIHNPFGMLGSVLGLNSGKVSAQNADTRDAVTDVETTYSFANYNGADQMVITWCDNNYGDRPKIGDWASKFIPQFKVGEDGEWINLLDGNGRLTSEAGGALHIEGDVTPNWAHVSASQTSIGDWTVSFSGMPTTLTETLTWPKVDENTDQPVYDANGDRVYDTSSSSTTVQWRLVDTNTLPDNYIYGENDGGPTGDENGQNGHRYLMLTQNYSFTITGKLGESTLKGVFGPEDPFSGEYADYFRFSAMIDNKQVTDETGAARSVTIAEMASERPNDFQITYSDDGNTAYISAKLPMYTTAGEPIAYYAFFENQSQEQNDDYFQAAYDNTGSPSHGSSTTALYNGGVMTLRPVGTVSYSAKKVWLDGGNQTDRPEVTFTLWRYSSNGSFSQASQVQLSEVEQGGGESPVQGASAQYVSITVPADSNGAVDLHNLLESKYGDAIDKLPKYDPDGYPYIYALREEGSPAGYELVHGVVGQDGNVTDTAPNYEDINGEPQSVNDYERNNDPFIYNGGTATNRLTGTIEVEGTKTWKIAAFQDALKDVKTTFQAQFRLEGSDDEWENADGVGATVELSGWNAETLTKSFSGTFSKYDSQGRALEYRWIESKVEFGDQDTNLQSDGNGGGTFTLTLQNREGENEELEFTSQIDPGTGEIVNSFDNTTNENVQKLWEQPDGSYAPIKPEQPAQGEEGNRYPDDTDLDGKATVELFQDGVKIGDFTMDGDSDLMAQPIQGLEGATWQETSPYYIEFNNLPKYDEGGVRYSYLVLETSKQGWHADRKYNADKHLTTITNAVGDGEGSEIRVIKEWNDGDDAEHRLTVVVDLVATTEMTAKENIDPATGQLYHYMPGDTVLSNIELSAANSWFAEVDVPIGGLSYNNFKVVEVGLKDENDTFYPVVANSEEAESAYENIGIDKSWINTGWNYESTKDTSRVATPDHVYETTASKADEPNRNDSMRAVVAGNRRLGLIDLTVVKTWKDGAIHPDRPKATLEVVCTEYENAFSVDDQGNVWIQISHNKLPVMNAAGDDGENAQARQLNTARDPVAVENGRLLVTIKTDSDESQSTFHIYGLPKYDNDGIVVHYDINEVSADLGEYASNKDVSSYTVGPQHFHDSQTFTFENKRAATRDVTFYKQWNDRYVNDGLNQRPDIYLTLYRVTVTAGENNSLVYSAPETVTGYVHYLWHATGDTTDPQYAQSCTIEGLPAYDSDGNEYIYYASESMSADGSSLDYAPVKFDTTGIEGDDFVINGDGIKPEEKYVKIDSAAPSNDPAENGTGYAIHEGGTFVNDLTNNVVASGVKLWENVPGNVNQDDLPDLTVYLQQRVQGEDSWPALKFECDENGNWQFADGTSAVAWTSDLTRTTTNQYTYQLKFTGENTSEDLSAETPPEGQELLPRYDEDGNLYEYRAIEVIWGLVGQPGGITADDIEEIDFSQQRDFGDESQGIYVIGHGETGSFLLNNTYASEKGNLTVKKLFEGRDSGDLYPDITFDVYRYYVNDAGEKSSPSRVATHTISGEELNSTENSEDGNLVVKENNGNNSAEYTFTDLDIYAPDGSYWQYYVVEHAINGYTTTVNVGDIDSTDEVTGSGDQTSDGIRSNDLCKTNSATADDPAQVTNTVIKANDTTPDVTFKNSYKPDTISISGTKTWDDYSNLLGLRPTAEQFMEALTFKQIGNGSSEGTDLTDKLQKVDANAPFFYTILSSAENSDVFTITISNLEKWAPDGTAWHYQISENLDNMQIGTSGNHYADGYYQAVGGISQTVTANSSNASFSFRNKLKGSVTVHKDWENDGNDAYGLRPSSVTVRLQARITYESNMPDENGWEDACGLFQHNGYGEKLSQLLTALGQSEEQFFQRELNDGNGWNASWTGLPTAGIGKASGQGGNSFFTIEYRAVEIAIGDQEIESQPTEDATEENEGKIYGANTVSSYEPSQSDTGDAENGFHSTVTNTLDDTSITVTKTWSDGGDKWGIRPGTDTWSVTYLLQRKTGNDNDYSWVLEYSENDETVEITSPLNKRIVSQTISGGLSDNEKQVTWRNLPRTDDSGNAYEYRVIEQVPGGYDVTNGTPLTDSNGNPVTATDVNGVTWRYYVVEGDQDVGDGTDSQSFINALRTVDLQGTKVWEDFGTDIADSYTAADMPQMTLYRAIKNNDGTLEAGEQVKMKDGSDPAQPTWNKNSDGIWIFTYSDLPAADEQDRPYTYWAEEVDVTTDGFYPLYGTGEDQDASSHDASGTKIEKEATATESGQQTNETITNVATKLSLAKVSDFDTDPNTAGVQGEQLANIELSVMSVDGGTTYAVWTNGDGEKYKTYTWVNGTTTPEETENAICREDDNLIVGLPAGNYKVVETGEVPDGYAKASDVEFTINADGTVEAPSNATTTTEENIHTINVTAIDPVLRGHLQLTKRVSDDGAYDGANAAALVGAKFDLYRVDVDDDGKDERIASGLTTDSQGVITTVDNDAAISGKSSTGNFDLTYGGKYTKLSDGLPEGKYYFVETDATSGAVMPSAEAVKSDILEITQEEHYDYTNAPVEITMGNEKFNATVVLYKFDTVTSAGIGSAKFSLSYTPEGASTPSYTTDVTTDADGTLTLSGLEKGEYNLKETYNDGYDITNSFEATFIIDNDDDDKTFNIKNVSDGADIGFTVTSGEGTFIDGKGIPNTPLRGSVTMAKTGMDNVALNGATFELQRMNGTDWTTQEPTTIASGLVTGQTYQMNEDNTGVGAGTAGVDGQIQVNNLLWGTYRFIETDPAPGYVGVSSDGSNITSDDLVISRMNLNPSMMGNDAVRNTPTSLEINKQNDKGGALKDAQFEVTPIEGSKFADDTTNAKTITSGDDGHAILEGQLVVGGTYTIYETKGPLGYDPIDESLTIKVLENGDLEVEGDMPTGWKRADIDNDGQIDNQFSFMAINNPMTIEVEKVSSNDANIKLKGAKFSLTGVCMDNESTHTYMTDEQGKLKIDDGLIKGEHYTLTEVTTPAGYVSVGSLQFTMNERGEIDVENAEDMPAGWTVKGDKVSLVAADNPVKLQITKHAPASADGTPGKVLEGATFTIAPVGESTFADGSKTAREFTTDGNGIISSSAELVVGNQYDITETAAPEGYERVTGTMRIQVADDGTIQVVGSVENGQVTGNLAPSGYSRVGDNAFEVQVTNNPVEISIKKISSEDHETYLPNTTFELEGHFAGDTVGTSRVETVTSDENGTINISAKLVSGETYKLTETHAPEGYELNNVTLSFTVNENGTITVNGDMPDGYTVEQGNVTIVAADTPIVVDFLKKDLGDTTTLAGGEFRLSGTFVNDKTHEISQQEITFTASENGFSFANMAHDGATYSLVAGNTYTIEETTAPDGYELTDPFSFMVSDNGTITVAEGFATAAEGQEGYTISDTNGTATLTAHDTPIEAKLIKVSGEKKLSGAVFELYEGSFATGTSVGNPMTTGDDGSVELEGLVTGKTYTLHEVTAPSGYELLSDVSFKVSSEGEISLVNEVAGYSVATDDGIATITANDTPIEAQLVKTNEEGAPLEGAVFTIEGTFAGDYAGQRTIELGATDESGIATVPAAVLIAGETYTLTEITAPQGYELAGSVQFSVGVDGTISLTGATEDTSTIAGTDGTGTYTTSATEGMAVITATDHLAELTITKTDDEGTLLSGAEFTATEVLPEGQTGNPHVVSGTTDENGSLVLTGLIAGKQYTLTETKAPAGYELLTDELTFTVNSDGTIDAGWFPPAAFEVDQDAVSVTDDKLLVTILKQDPNGNPLAGAEFAIEGEFPDGDTSKSFASSDEGIVFENVQFIGSSEGTRYEVTETNAPEGFASPQGGFEMLVYEDGTVEVLGDSDLAQAVEVTETGGTAVITVNNEPLPGTELTKTGDIFAPLVAGALGLLGLTAIITAAVARRVLRRKE